MLNLEETDPQTAERRGDLTFASCIQKGMSANLYLVWHHRYWSPMVCKMLRAEDLDDKRWRNLLKAEGEILKKVSHPGIVRPFELNMTDTLPYLLLEYLPGITVRQMLQRKGPFSVQDAIRLTMYLGGTLRHVHQTGYIHRDIKPSNVMLHAGRMKLFDFGVGWPISDKTPPDKSGTPMYLAPEQCRQEVLTPAVDIWALGIFLFELITKQIPFPASDYHNYEAKLEDRYSQLVGPAASFKDAGRRVPASLQRIVSRCLAFDPAERYQDVQDLLIELDPLCKIKIWPVTSDATDLATFLEI